MQEGKQAIYIYYILADIDKKFAAIINDILVFLELIQRWTMIDGTFETQWGGSTQHYNYYSTIIEER